MINIQNIYVKINSNEKKSTFNILVEFILICYRQARTIHVRFYYFRIKCIINYIGKYLIPFKYLKYNFSDCLYCNGFLSNMYLSENHATSGLYQTSHQNFTNLTELIFWWLSTI